MENQKNIFSKIENINKENPGVFMTPEGLWPVNEHKKENPTNQPATNTTTPNTQDLNLKKMENTCNKNRKLITKDIDVASGSAAGTYPVIATFGTEYKRIIGYAFITTSLGGLTAVQTKVGLSDSSRTILDPTLIDWHTFSTAVPVDKRLNKEETIEMSGGQVTVNVKTAATTSSAFQIQLVALVERD